LTLRSTRLLTRASFGSPHLAELGTVELERAPKGPTFAPRGLTNIGAGVTVPARRVLYLHEMSTRLRNSGVGQREDGLSSSVQRRPRAWLLAAALAISGAATVVVLVQTGSHGTAEAHPSAEPPCVNGPPPTCVTSIKFVDPSTFEYSRTSNGALRIVWSPDGPGVTEQVNPPVSYAQAAARAAEEAKVKGLVYGAPTQPAVGSVFSAP
jgi:hypothetical protein